MPILPVLKWFTWIRECSIRTSRADHRSNRPFWSCFIVIIMSFFWFNQNTITLTFLHSLFLQLHLVLHWVLTWKYYCKRLNFYICTNEWKRYIYHCSSHIFGKIDGTASAVRNTLEPSLFKQLFSKCQSQILIDFEAFWMSMYCPFNVTMACIQSALNWPPRNNLKFR